MTDPGSSRPGGAHGPAGDGDGGGLVGVIVVAAAGAIAVGFVGGAFRWALVRAADWRTDLVGWTRETPGPAWLIPIAVTAVGAGTARWLVRFAPDAAGSGVQEVEGVWAQQLPEPGWRVLPIKFVGGLLALGSGMVLGREGPTVHMGSVIGAVTSRRLRLPPIDSRILQAALGGAGLAVAFNAPIGGALFVFEEVTRSFRPKLVMVTLIGCAVAVGCSRLVVGDRPDFLVRLPETPPIGQLWVFVAFGLLLGVVGAGYNAMVVGALRVTDAMVRIGPVVRATVIGAVVGTLLVIEPLTVGGGDTLSQDVLGGEGLAIRVLIGYVCVRLVAGPLSYAAGTPGGLFAPLLAVGALLGALANPVAAALSTSFDQHPASLMVVGMAAFFTAIVRAPFTGVVLIIEMTGATTLNVPVLAACAAAMLAATLVRSPPIYDTLKLRAMGASSGR